MNEIQYFRATEADLQIMIDYRISFQLNFWGAQPQEAIDELREHLHRQFSQALRNNAYICWYAKSGDDVAGIGGLTIRESPGNFKNPSGRVGYIMSMYTVPAYRRKGICSGVLSRLIASAKEMDIHAFELHATNEGEPVYIKNGFELHNEPTYRKYE